MCTGDTAGRTTDARVGRPSALSLDYWAQVDATILTVSTFSGGGAFVEELASDGLAVALALAGAMVPLISTFCPTCDFSFASSASSR